MAGWMKLVLGVVLSLGIFGGVVAFVNDLHPMRPAYSAGGDCTTGANSGSESQTDCFDRRRANMARSDSNDRWAAAAAGAVAVALFWLLVNFVYIRPRRRRMEAAGQG